MGKHIMVRKSKYIELCLILITGCERPLIMHNSVYHTAYSIAILKYPLVAKATQLLGYRNG